MNTTPITTEDPLTFFATTGRVPDSAIISHGNATNHPWRAIMYSQNSTGGEDNIGTLLANTEDGLHVLLSQIGLYQKHRNNPWYFELCTP